MQISYLSSLCGAKRPKQSRTVASFSGLLRFARNDDFIGCLVDALRGRSFPDRLIYQCLQFQLNSSALRGRLHHADCEHVVLRVDEKDRASHTVPAIFAQWPGIIGWLGSAHRKAKPEP